MEIHILTVNMFCASYCIIHPGIHFYLACQHITTLGTCSYDMLPPGLVCPEQACATPHQLPEKVDPS